jgi:hypothetical protein
MDAESGRGAAGARKKVGVSPAGRLFFSRVPSERFDFLFCSFLFVLCGGLSGMVMGVSFVFLVGLQSWRSELVLAYQSLGVVYGDLATSPLYVYKSAFAGGDIEHSEGNEEIYGVLSLVFWTLTLITLLKYVLVVLRAADDGEGGTFALYSLICRRVRAGLLPGVGDSAVDELKDQPDGALPPPASSVRAALQQRRELQWLLLLFALLGTSMVIGDGVLTPAVSGRTSPPCLNCRQYPLVGTKNLTCASVSLFSVLSGFGAQAVNGQ